VWELGCAPLCFKRSHAADCVGARLRPFCCKRSRAVDRVGARPRPLLQKISCRKPCATCICICICTCIKQCEAMQSNAKQCKARQCKAVQSNGMQSNAKQCKARQRKVKQCKTRQCKAKQSNCHDVWPSGSSMWQVAPFPRKANTKRTLPPQCSASKPGEQDSTKKHLRRTPHPHSSVSKHAEHDSAQKPQGSATEPASQDGEVLADQRYEELQECLQQVFSDCNVVWRSSTSNEKQGPRKSWRAAMGCLQDLLETVFYETLTSTESKNLSEDHRSKLSNAAALLWEKIQRRKTRCVLQNQMTHLQEVVQATSADVCYKSMVDELLVNEALTEAARQEQVTYLRSRIYDASVQLQAARTRAK
jgi:hypothetical protein